MNGPPFARFLPVAMALFLIQLDFFALGLALPVIAVDLGSTTTDLQWVLSGYMLALGSFMIPASRIADMLGRKRVLLTGVAVFGVASLLCGLSQTSGELIAVRVLQGLGGALILPVAFSLVTHDTTESERPRALGLMLGMANIGTAIGPIVGGGLATTVGWRWVFWVNVPLALVAFVWGSRSLRESRDPDGRSLRDLDWTGVLLVVAGVCLASWGLDNLDSSTLLAPTTGGAIVVGLALLAVLAWHETRHPWPLVSPDLMRRRSFVGLLAAGTVANIGYCMMMLVVTIQLQQVRGFTAAIAGALFVFPAVATALSGPLSGRLAGKVPDGLVMAVAIVAGCLGLLLQALTRSLALDIVGLMLSALSFAMGYAYTNIASQTVLPVELSGQASGVIMTALVTLGGIGVVLAALGIELFGAGNLDQGTTDTLLWTGLTGLAMGAVFLASQIVKVRRSADVAA
ncbi:MAG: MFS transporter [Candidatus Nanopelagicales bacterium]